MFLDQYSPILPDNVRNFDRPKVFDLKDESGVGIIVDYSRDYTFVNGV